MLDQPRLGIAKLVPRATLSPPEEVRKLRFQESVEFQVNHLKTYLGRYQNHFREFGVDLALSGGFDSRLLLAALKQWPLNVHCHTYSGAIDGMHDDDCRCSRAIAESRGYELTLSTIREPDQMEPGEAEATLDAGMRHFDGETYVGWLRPLRTAEFQKTLMADRRFIVNGLGGELYRNHNRQAWYPTDTTEWFKHSVARPHTVWAVDRKHYLDTFIDRAIVKVEGILKESLRPRVGPWLNKRFYCEVWGPDMDGILSSTNNRLTFSLHPFADRLVFEAGYASIRHHGVAECFESAMLRRLSPELAALPSNYGFALSNVPVKHRLRCLLLATTPNRIKNYWLLRELRKRPAGPRRFDRLAERHSHLRHVRQLLRDTRLPLDWDRLFAEPRFLDIGVSVGHLLDRYQDRIEIGT